ncbi:unnamed protein product [Prunus armeniaca]|uniref:Uncharacterized protein n=1 Tax=Prunus armeniaca TaxID=36596 RepID=A0A6J5VDD6_PRUAR|nr:unnamed protein product [Prunus armeniaca]
MVFSREGRKPGKELTNTQARQIKRQYGKARREMEYQSMQSSPPRAHQATRNEFQREGRSTVGMLRIKGAPEQRKPNHDHTWKIKKQQKGRSPTCSSSQVMDHNHPVQKSQDWEQAKLF